MQNDFEREATPIDKSVSWWTISIIYMGLAITLPMFYLMADVGLSLGLCKGLFAVCFSVLFLSILGSFTGFIGAKSRLSTYMITSIAFGHKVSKFINFIMAIVLLGWYALTLTYFGESVYNFLLTQFNISINVKLLTIIGGVLILSTAIFGFEGINKLSWATIPFLLLLLYIMLFNSTIQQGISGIATFLGNGNISFEKSVSILIGSFICGVSILPDISRYAKKPKDGVLGGICGFLGGQLIVGIPCLITGIAYQNNDFIVNAVALSPIVAFMILVFATWTTNDNNLYSTSLSLAVIFEKIKKIKITITLGILGIIFACLNITNYFVPFLSFLAIIFPSIASINVVDFFLNTKKYENYQNDESNVNIFAVIAWFIGNFVALLSYYDTITITSISAIDGFIFAGLSYYILNKIKK